MKKSLLNIKILITRDEHQCAGLVRKIHDLGGKAIVFPTVEIKPPVDMADCDRVIKNIRDYDWIIFTSSNGVRFFFDRLKNQGAVKIGASLATVGEKTAVEVRNYGYDVEVMPEEYNASGLLKTMSELNISGKKILWPTSDLSSDELSNGLESYGAVVDKVTFYRTVKRTKINAMEDAGAVNPGSYDCITFFSPSQFRSFLDITGFGRQETKGSFSKAIAAIGPATAKAIRKEGLTVSIYPEKSTEDHLVEAIVNYYENQEHE